MEAYIQKGLHVCFWLCLVLFLLFAAWSVFGGCGADVHDHGGGADSVRESLERAGNEQRNAESHIVNVGRQLDDSAGRIDAIADGIDEAESRIESVQSRSGECAGILADSERRITESRAILEAIRGRAQAAREST